MNETTSPTVAEMEARVMEWLGWTRMPDAFEMAPPLWHLIYEGKVFNIQVGPFQYGSDLNLWPPIFEKLCSTGRYCEFCTALLDEMGLDRQLIDEIILATAEQRLRALCSIL